MEIDAVKSFKYSVSQALYFGISKETLIGFIEDLYKAHSATTESTTLLSNIEPFRYFLDEHNRWGIIVGDVHGSSELDYVYYPDNCKFEVRDRFHTAAQEVYEPKQRRFFDFEDVDKPLFVVAFLKDSYEPKLLYVKPNMYYGITIRDMQNKSRCYNLDAFVEDYYLDVSSNVPKIEKENVK